MNASDASILKNDFNLHFIMAQTERLSCSIGFLMQRDGL